MSGGFPADEFEISADPGRLDVGRIHRFLAESYWARDIPLEVLRTAISNSLCFGAYHRHDGQVGFARVVTDRATFAYLADFLIVDGYRGKGLAERLLGFVMAHPDLDVRRHLLSTRDAHGLYAKAGFGPLTNPDRTMEILRLDFYQRARRNDAT